MHGSYVSTEKTANFIGGRWVGEPETMSAINPATGEEIAKLPKSSRETAGRAVAAAKAAAPKWAATPVFKRAQMCVDIAAAIDAERVPCSSDRSRARLAVDDDRVAGGGALGDDEVDDAAGKPGLLNDLHQRAGHQRDRPSDFRKGTEHGLQPD